MMKVPEELLPVVEWWEKNGKRAMACALVVGVVVLAVWAWMSHRERMLNAESDKTRWAISDLARVQSAAMGNEADVALRDGSIDSLRRAVADFGDKSNGPALKLMLAAAYFTRRGEGDCEQALAIYESLASGATPKAFDGIPQLGRANCLEALKRTEDAVKAYDDFIAAFPEHALTLDAKLGKARAMVAGGDKAGAIAYLDTVKASVKDDEPLAKAAVEATAALVKRWTERKTAVPAPVTPAPSAEGK